MHRGLVSIIAEISAVAALRCAKLEKATYREAVSISVQKPGK
jgi:hypothetical protein